MSYRDHVLRWVVAAMLAAAVVVWLVTAGGCAGVTYTAKRTVTFDMVTGEAEADRGCRIAILVDGKERFTLAENPTVDCAVTVAP